MVPTGSFQWQYNDFGLNSFFSEAVGVIQKNTFYHPIKVIVLDHELLIMTKTMKCLKKRTRGVSFTEWLVLGTCFGELLRKEQLLFHLKKGAWGGHQASDQDTS